MKTSCDSHTYLTEVEKDGVYSYVINKLNLDDNVNNDNVVYNYCKYYLIENEETTRIDKDQSLSAMSRSLSLYFSLLSILMFVSILFQPSLIKFVSIIISLILAILFYYRCIRFAKLRYIYIFRAFYYSVVAK